MNSNPLFAALLSIAMSVAAQFSLKRGVSGASSISTGEPSAGAYGIASVLMNPYVLLGLALYAASAVVWLSVLSRWDVSKAYPMVGLGFGLTAVIGWLAGEPLTAQRLIGVLAICGGVVLVARS